MVSALHVTDDRRHDHRYKGARETCCVPAGQRRLRREPASVRVEGDGGSRQGRRSRTYSASFPADSQGRPACLSRDRVLRAFTQRGYQCIFIVGGL